MDRNGYFRLYNDDSGIYLECFPHMDNGAPVKIDDVIFYLDAKGIKGIDVTEINKYIANGDFSTKFKLTNETGYHESEYLKIEVDKYGGKVVGRFFAPSNEGDVMTKDEIIEELKRNNINHGYVMKNIDIFVRARLYCTDILLAKATAPIHGHDARIEYYFDTEVVAKPKLNDDGTVDFHQLGNISHVEAGAMLAKLYPEDPGTPGMDVFGQTILPKKVERKVLKCGKNISLSDDKLEMYTDVSGHATLVDGTVFVSDTYEVPANVDASTGDIEYSGNVLIKGNVNTGYTVKATGDISVSGVVEGATLIAGGDITLRLGVQGIFKAHLNAGGNIVSRFFENCKEVYAGGTITTDAIMHSKVKAKGDIEVRGKRGLITGGEIISGTQITAKTVGSPMETPTILEVGVDPTLMDEYHELEKNIEDRTDEMEKLMQILAVYQKRMKSGEKLTPDKVKYVQDSNAKYKKYESENEQAKERMKEILEEFEVCKNGLIKVSGTTYAGVNITISRAILKVKDAINHSKYRKEGADVRIAPF